MVDDAEYTNLLAEMNLKPLLYNDVANDWQASSVEWYHAMIAIEDLPIVLAIPTLRIYAWCRCKVVADDGSDAHFHWHGLVHFKNEKLEIWKRKARKVNIKFKSTKNTFKKIKCLDHAVGVLRYIACKDGQKVGRRDGDGLLTHPHVHYSRQPIEHCHEHDSRRKICATVRNEISEKIAAHIDFRVYPSWETKELHDIATCLCDRGSKGKATKAASNEKRRAFYKTEAGLAMKMKYREKSAVKKRIMNQLIAMNVSKKAHLCKETIENLLKQL